MGLGEPDASGANDASGIMVTKNASVLSAGMSAVVSGEASFESFSRVWPKASNSFLPVAYLMSGL
jgi:hypothetical protein